MFHRTKTDVKRRSFEFKPFKFINPFTLGDLLDKCWSGFDTFEENFAIKPFMPLAAKTV